MADTVNSVLMTKASEIGPKFRRKTINTSPWLKLVPRGKWQRGLSDTLQVPTSHRTWPTSDPVWEAVSFNDGKTNTCAPVAKIVGQAQDLRTFQLYQTALESDDFCVLDILNTYEAAQQLKNSLKNLQANTRYWWVERLRSEYTSIADHKVIAAPGLPESDSAFPLQVPTSRLTQGLLDWFHHILVRDGVGEDGMIVDRVDNKPQLMLVCGSEISDIIKRSDDKVREDFRNTSRAAELLGPLGVDGSYRGFYHLVDDYPPRWNFVGGAWVRVPPFTTAAATSGTADKLIPNPDYRTALAEDAFIFVPAVYTSLMPPSITNPGAGIKYKPQNYMGDWKWINGWDRTENPDNNKGYFRGVFMNASEPNHPEFGVVIRALRCDGAELILDDCPATS